MAIQRRTAGKRKKGPSDLEVLFANLWSIAGDRSRRPVTQFKFHPDRKWKFDAAWPDVKVAIEIEGGVYRGGHGGGTARGGHNSATGFQKDIEKYNAAAELGWRVLRYTTKDLHERSVAVIEQVRRVIEGKGKR